MTVVIEEDGLITARPRSAAIVSEVMVRHPKVLPADATLAEADAALADDHVHLALLTDGRLLAGTLTREDLVRARDKAVAFQGLALPWATLDGRSVHPTALVEVVREQLVCRGWRRSAVVDEAGHLVGLLCLKHTFQGFCSDSDVAARAAERG